MTRWHGRMGRGAGRAVRIEKREEAQARDAASTYNADIRRVAAGRPLPPNASRPFRRGYEMATEVDGELS